MDLPPRLHPNIIEERLACCARLPSLSTVSSALRELLNADHRYTTQVAEVIRRDPSLTARLLRLVNSVYFGMTTPINSIEEAVFYLGVRQIRQLAMVTPIIEDFQRLAGRVSFPWREFWQHCIAAAILTRETIAGLRAPTDEVDYVAGLIHDVGKIVMASAFPEHFAAIYPSGGEPVQDLLAREHEVLGMTHAEVGALYLNKHRLPEVMIEAARCHHEPERASHHAQVVAAVQIGNLLARHAGIGCSGNGEEVTEERWMEASGWDILFPGRCETELRIARANLKRCLERLPTILEGIV